MSEDPTPLALPSLFDLDQILTDAQAFADDGLVFVTVLVGTYLLGRFLLLPPIVRGVQLRNRNNPTLVGAIQLYLRIAFAFVGLVLAIRAAGFGSILSGSALVVAAGTLALGVAGQDVMSNLVSGVFLVMDENFNVGDYIEWGDNGGTVLKIGLRTTRVRTPNNEVLTVPNDDLATAQVNHPHDQTRYRVNETVVVSYADEIERIRSLLKPAVAAHERVLDSPSPEIHLTTLGPGAVEVTVRYWVQEPATARIPQIRSHVATAIKTTLQEADIEIAPANQQELSGSVEFTSEEDRQPSAES